MIKIHKKAAREEKLLIIFNFLFHKEPIRVMSGSPLIRPIMTPKTNYTLEQGNDLLTIDAQCCLTTTNHKTNQDLCR